MSTSNPTPPATPAEPEWEKILLDIEGAADGLGAVVGGSFEARLEAIESTVNLLIGTIQTIVSVIKPPATVAVPADLKTKK
jgi:hypothetical protein